MPCITSTLNERSGIDALRFAGGRGTGRKGAEKRDAGRRKADRVGAEHRMTSTQNRPLLVISFPLAHVVALGPPFPFFLFTTPSDV